MLESGICYDSTNRQSTRKLTTKIICSSVGINTISYIYISKEVKYHKPVALLIQYRLIKKVDCIG